MTITGLGNLPSSVDLQPAMSSGVAVIFSPSNISLLSQASVQALISVKNGTKPGNYNLQAVADGGGGSFNLSLSIQVVQYLVAIEPIFAPGNLTVTVGSTVTWIRLNAGLGEHENNGSQNIVFNNHMASSPQLLQWQSWSYAFTQAGSFPYTSTYQNESAVVTVIPS